MNRENKLRLKRVWRKVIHTLCGCLSVGAGQRYNTLVHLDSYHHSSLLNQLREKLAIISLLIESLMEKDDSTDAGLDAVVSGEQQLTVQPSVLLCVLSVYALEALCNTA